MGRDVTVPLPSRLRRMTAVEQAWVGAFIEADGCVSWDKTPRCPRWLVFVTQVDPEPISTLLRFTGAGSVYARHHPRLIFVWTLYRIKEVQDIAAQCAEFCPKLRRVP